MQRQYRLQQVVSIVSAGFRQLFEEFEFWCSAEIADIKPYKSRLYIDLIEADDAGTILAKAKAIVREPSIMQRFLKKTAMHRSELVGTTILLRGSCTFHEKYGRSISVKEISSEYTRGKQVTHRESVINQIKKLWLRQKNKETILARKPLRLAVVTGRSSSGFEDFKMMMQESGYHWSIISYPCAIHGNQAIQEVAQQLNTIHTLLETDPALYDAVLIMRGWWGKDGFLWQDDLMIWSLVWKIPIPVIVAVGHTRDTTLLDDTCWYSAKTPSEAAHILIAHLRTTYEQIQQTYTSIQEYATHRQQHIIQQIEELFEWIQFHSDARKIILTKEVTELYRSIQSYDPLLQLEHGYSLVTDAKGTLLWKSTLEPWIHYQLYHGSQKYTMKIVDNK